MNKKLNFKIYSEKVDPSPVKLAVDLLQKPGFEITSTVGKRIKLQQEDIILLGIRELEDKFLNEILEVKNSNKNKVIIFTDSEDPIVVSTLSRLGFNEIFILPSELQKLKSELSAILDNSVVSKEDEEDVLDRIIGTSQAIKRIKELAQKVAQNSSVNLLILGETGTGKGLLARAIHDSSPNSSSPFVDIVCSAIPSTLLEAELFGYEAGAFTDAKTKKIGLFELAEDGTIFLDEIGDVSLELQAKLLKAIDNKITRRLGGTEDIPVKARIISATNKDLEELIKQKLFRMDLYHRLNPITLTIPPLRERQDDVSLITKKLIDEFSDKFNKKVISIDNKTKEFLVDYSWPGNVRELRNAVERAVLLSENSKLNFENMFPSNKNKLKEIKEKEKMISFNINYEEINLNDLTLKYVLEVYKKLDKNKSKAAKILGISRPKLDRMLAEK